MAAGDGRAPRVERTRRFRDPRRLRVAPSLKIGRPGAASAGTSHLDRSCWFDLPPQIPRPSLVMGVVMVRASLTPRIAGATAARSHLSQLHRFDFEASFRFFEVNPRCSARKKVLADFRSRFFRPRTDFLRREVHFLASRAVFSQGTCAFSGKRRQARSENGLSDKKEVSCSLEKTFLAEEKTSPRRKRRFLAENRVFYGRRRVSREKRTLPTLE